MKLILVAPDLDKKMKMKIDILDYVIKGILSMECEDGRQRLVAYFSKSLNEIKHILQFKFLKVGIRIKP